MNILYYDSTSGYGGSSRCLLSWLEKIDQDKYAVTVVANHDGPVIKKIGELGVQLVKSPFRGINPENKKKMLSYPIFFLNFIFIEVPQALFLVFVAKKHKADIFHLNSKVVTSIPGIIAARLCGKPCICHLHDINVPVKREKYFARYVDCFVVLTQKALELYSREYPRKMFEMIPNGIDLEDYGVTADAAGTRLELGIGSEALVSIVGRLVEGKGFPDFIYMAEILSRRRSDVKYLIVGSSADSDNKHENYLKSLVHSLGLDSTVIFSGWKENVKNIIAACDIIVQASTFPEGFGLTVIEAMALGKPVVVTAVPGPSELVQDGSNGYIVPASDPEKLAAAVERILSDRDLARSMGLRGRQMVEKYYNLESIVWKMQGLYDLFSPGGYLSND